MFCGAIFVGVSGDTCLSTAEEMATQISKTCGDDNGAILKKSVVGAKEIPSPLQGEMKARAEIPAVERGTTTQK